MAECSTNVLVVNGSIDERNHAAKAGGQSSRTEMTTEELLELLR
jgi:hypothetical protein